MMNIMCKVFVFIKNCFAESFNIGLAIVLLVGLFYLRLVPRISRDLWENMTTYQIFSTCFSMVLIIFNIYLLLKILGIIPTNEKPKPKFSISLIFRKISEYLTWVLVNFYEFILYIVENVANNWFHVELLPYRILNRLSRMVLRMNKTVLFWSLISIKVLPSLIFVLAFTYDVLWCKQLNYTFKCIPWLLVPLLERFIKFIFDDFYDGYYEEMRDSMYMEETENPEIIAFYLTPEFAENPPDFVKDSEDFYDNHYVVLDDIKQLFVNYEIWKYDVFPYVYLYLFIYFLRLAVLFYVLFYGVM